MALVRKANVLLDIKESDIDRYLSQGYLLVDDEGNVLKEGEPTDLESYKRAYVRLTEKVNALEEELKALKKSSGTSTKKKATAKTEKAEPENVE